MMEESNYGIDKSNYGIDKLSSEIFSILESKFLFGNNDDRSNNYNLSHRFPSQATPLSSAISGGRIRILSIDSGGSTDGLLAAASLAILESSLQHVTNESSTRIPDFFDVAAGSGVGGVLTALIFSRNGETGRPLLSAAEALQFLSKHHRVMAGSTSKRGALKRLFGSKKSAGERVFRAVFSDLTLRDTVKPVLIPCYDLATVAPFVFSHADAMETDGYDFMLRDVCAATMGMPVAGENVRSVDGRTAIDAATVEGGVAMGNPSSVAITHVLNNNITFPFVKGVEDVFLVSIGNGEGGGVGGGSRQPAYATPSSFGIARIAGDGVSDMIDQAVAMAFGQNRSTNYIRIQGREVNPGNSGAKKDPAEFLRSAEEMLAQRNVESVLFRGKKLSEKTNAEKLDWAAGELVKEHERRKKSPIPIVVSKRGSPRCSSSSSSAISSSTSSP